MKFYLKQKIVTPSPPAEKGIEKVGGVTEYEALRAEKLFRYEYSNQLNTSLLNFAFTIFTAGLALFSIIIEFGNLENAQQTIGVFIEYFFAAFFLLPCFFARINFKYTVHNSLRICQLTDYVRSKICFDDNESWEGFKQKYRAHYFYKQSSRIGGAKEIPICVSLVSISISFSIFCIFTYTRLQPISLTISDDFYIILYWTIRMMSVILTAVVVQCTHRRLSLGWYGLILVSNIGITYILAQMEIIKWDDYFFVTLLWAELFHFCVYSMPQYLREIRVADFFLDFTQKKLTYSKNNDRIAETINRDQTLCIVKLFLEENQYINIFISKKKKRKWSNKRIAECLQQYLTELIISENDLSKQELGSVLNEYINGKDTNE